MLVPTSARPEQTNGDLHVEVHAHMQQVGVLHTWCLPPCGLGDIIDLVPG